MRLQIWLWGLLVVGLLCQVHGHTEDDEDFVEDDIVKDEAMEDEESEEHTLPIDSEEPKERVSWVYTEADVGSHFASCITLDFMNYTF